MLIYHAGTGELRGKVLGVNELKSADPDLARIWKERISQIPSPVHDRQGKFPQLPGHGARINHGSEARSLHHIHDPHPAEDREWAKNVIAILASHGYRGDPVGE